MTESPDEGGTDMFTITVFGTTDLDITSPMHHVIARISIVDMVTGELIEKSDPTRPCISALEATDYISPVATKGVKLDNLGDLCPQWNEHFSFNEPVDTLLSDNVLIFFEILETFVHPGNHGFTPLAWAFLRLRNPDDCRNLGHPVLLQLHSYPSPAFDTTIRSPSLAVAKLLLARRKCSARLTVEVKGESGQAIYEISDRPAHFFQREVSAEPLAKLIEKPEGAESSDAQDGAPADGDRPAKRPKARRDLKPANRNCTIPRRLKAQIPAGERGALALQFNRNGSVLAVAIQELSEYVVQFFDADAMRKFATVRAHVDLIYELQWSPDDRLLLSASADGMVKIWKGDGSHKLKQTLVHAGYIYSAKFHPQDDRIVVTAGIDRVIRLWDRPSEVVLRELAGHEVRVNSIAFAPDGKTMFSGDADGVIIVWATDLGEHGLDGIARAKVVREGEIAKVPITHVEMGRSNFSLIVHTRDNMVRVFETKVMVPAQRYSGLVCRRFQMMSTFSPDSQFILAGSEDGSVVLWTTKKAELVAVKEWNCKFDHPVTAVAWNRVENMVAFSSFGDAQPVLVFYDPDAKRQKAPDDLDW